MHFDARTASFDDGKPAPKPVKSALYLSGDIDPVQYDSAVDNEGPFLMADDPRESVGYRYPTEYVNYFGPDFTPSAFVRRIRASAAASALPGVAARHAL